MGLASFLASSAALSAAGAGAAASWACADRDATRANDSAAARRPDFFIEYSSRGRAGECST